jgi:DNA-binding LytR/AlgR family response regulator
MLATFSSHAKGQCAIVTEGHALRILVVDDEFLIATFLEEVLFDEGCEVVGPVGAVAPALALIEESGATLDGAFLDINLRGELVYPVADAIIARGVPFAFLTGYGPKGVDPRFGTIPVLCKPFDALKIPDMLARFEQQRREKLSPRSHDERH